MGKKLYKKEIYKDFKSWCANRGIGGSSCSAIFNENKYQNKLDIYCALVAPPNERLKTAEDLDGEDTSSTLRGKELEPILRKMFAQKFKEKYKVHTPKNYEMYRSTKYDWATATLDGTLVDLDTGAKGVLEIKTHSNLGTDDMSNWDKQLPQNYYLQLLHYLFVLNDFDFAILMADIINLDYDNNLPMLANKGIGDEIRYYYITREQVKDHLELVEQVEREFVETSVKGRIPPNFTF